ncbi:N-acetylmuramoyl-L-alanine amidase [Kaistia dalseonensis]|uniref:N-acetylmuramoyl-L-alanine amidase n=1 Tax=Kaistia dalseonensis TaxID=410840 RepID=A0ABU0HCL5_9HYPH|nr:N-acetylmuramoyl-L-alanine amidase [Kaistia dalseonensis]MCX5497423.1 N-acetylmuramoyl-L-alanine amidase [Kaistia dalseonensis]MDQ0440062.1 N-acetylmuramoyl-L-alanine amidase [Kaistia dalseonensis]
MGYTIDSHRLVLDGKAVLFVATPNQGGTVKPVYLIIHYTAGATADGAINWFANPEAKASAHLVVGRDGETTQMVPFNRIAWHAGKSTWQGIDGLNAFSIGIEIVNRGKLVRTEGGVWQDWTRRTVPAAEVLVARHKNEASDAGWHTYTTEQIEAVAAIGIALNARYAFADVLGHEDIAPTRKTDPGPAFPLQSVASKILGRH